MRASPAGYVLFTTVDRRYLRMFDLWIRYYRETGLRLPLHVAAVGREACETVRARAARRDGLVVHPLEAGPRTVTARRLQVLGTLLDRGLDVISTDLDAFWLSNRTLELADRRFDVQMSLAAYGWPPAVVEAWGFSLCCGFSIIHANASTRKLMDPWIRRALPAHSDQHALNHILLDHGTRWRRAPRGDGADGACPALGLTLQAIDRRRVTRTADLRRVDRRRLVVFHPRLTARTEELKVLRSVAMLSRLRPRPFLAPIAAGAILNAAARWVLALGGPMVVGGSRRETTRAAPGTGASATSIPVRPATRRGTSRLWRDCTVNGNVAGLPSRPTGRADWLIVVRCATPPVRSALGVRDREPLRHHSSLATGGVMSLVAWFRLPRAQQGMALEAAAWLTLARVLVHHVPMRYWRGSLHTAASGQASAGRCALGRTLGRMVAGVARRLPFEAPCLPRALATQWMLRRRGVASRLVFGVRAPPRPGGARRLPRLVDRERPVRQRGPQRTGVHAVARTEPPPGRRFPARPRQPAMSGSSRPRVCYGAPLPGGNASRYIRCSARRAADSRSARSSTGSATGSVTAGGER